MRGTVLLVDDHAAFRLVARAVLEGAGLRVVGEAGDAAAALSAVDDLHPDLVLLDVHLPDGNGLDLVAPIRSRWNGCEIVLISSRGLEGAQRRALRSGAAGFLAKEDLSGPSLEGLLGARGP